MEEPQEPAWLRSYKRSAAPFSATTTKYPVRETAQPAPAERPLQNKTIPEEPISSTEEQSNTISMSFPSTISLGLKSFGQPPSQPVSSNTAIHPALRDDDNYNTQRRGTSDNSSTSTKVEPGYHEKLYEKTEAKEDRSWRRFLKSIVQRLGCGRS